MAKRVARVGVFIALALVFSYIEVLIPFHFGIPGVKLGIANLVIVSALYLMTTGEAFFISMIRIILVGILFGNGVSLIYSVAGGLLSFGVMLVLSKRDWFSVKGVSIAGAVSHNVGQIVAACIILSSEKIIYYLPILMVVGVITGLLIGLLSNRIIDAMKSVDKQHTD